MPRSSRVVELGHDFRLVGSVAYAVGVVINTIFRCVFIDFFDNGPCFYVSGISCCICIVIAIVVLIVIPVTVISITVIALASIVAIITIVVSSGWALTFPVAPLGPAFILEVAKLVAVVTFDILLVAFLSACSKSIF